MKSIRIIILLIFSFSGLIKIPDAQGQSSFIHRIGNETSLSVAPFQGKAGFGAQSSFTYPVVKGFQVGAGVGIFRFPSMNTYDTIEANFTMLPVYAKAEYEFLQKKLSPFLAAEGGYSFLINTPSSAETYRYVPVFLPYAWNEYYDYDAYQSGGYYFNFEAGLKYRISSKFKLLFSVDYTLLQVHGTHRSGLYQYLPDENMQLVQHTSYDSWDVMAHMQVVMIKIGVCFGK